MPNPVILEALGKHTATVIFAHGLGDSAAGWVPLARELRTRFQHIKWVLPTAPEQPVSINMGMSMTSWFDIQSLPPAELRADDDKGMLESVRTINKLITDETDAGLPSDRILVGGFSQGGCIAYLTGLTSERKLAGIAALSGWLGMADKIKSVSSIPRSILLMMTDHALKLPIFHGHGTGDQVVKHIWGKQSVDKLQEFGHKNIEFHSYPGMPHSFCPEEQTDLEVFIRKVLPEQ
ncbi:uncharacterized protein JCM15063_005191 [Sporobolomyces koalae]|uniref:uncharacterized protein n=1 Tax=Sporobolomyces koalae TaxID=500713 RepID=UPI0031720061